MVSSGLHKSLSRLHCTVFFSSFLCFFIVLLFCVLLSCCCVFVVVKDSRVCDMFVSHDCGRKNIIAVMSGLRGRDTCVEMAWLLLFHVSNMWIWVISCVGLASQPASQPFVLHNKKTLTLDIRSKLSV